MELILKASAELLAEGGVDALTTCSVSERTCIPVASIYRYFDSRDEIIAAYLDHELETMEESVTVALRALERVTFRSTAEAIAMALVLHHQTHPESVPVWFGGRLNAVVVDRVRALDTRLAASLHSAAVGSGMTADVPEFIVALLARLFDRMLEFVFLLERTADEQQQIALAFVDIVSTYIERFATPPGLEGISTEEFVRAFATNTGSLSA